MPSFSKKSVSFLRYHEECLTAWDHNFTYLQFLFPKIESSNERFMSDNDFYFSITHHGCIARDQLSGRKHDVYESQKITHLV